ILLATAHPDDEVMFFSPIILELAKNKKVNLHLLCLSNGDHDNLGKVREKELIEACGKLGINKNNIKVLNQDNFRDGPKELWPPHEVSNVLETYIIKNKIRTVLTFDLQGVSGHINHIALRVGVEHMLKTSTILNQKEKSVVAYQLESIPLLRKYISIFDLIFTLSKIDYTFSSIRHNLPDINVPNQILVISSLNQVLTSRNAMYQHQSQMVWFRHLYILFSRYMFISSF
ncbi:LmbE-like protein, partial [Neoconidiobolus thromboides FSU 785]